MLTSKNVIFATIAVVIGVTLIAGLQEKENMKNIRNGYGAFIMDGVNRELYNQQIDYLNNLDGFEIHGYPINVKHGFAGAKGDSNYIKTIVLTSEKLEKEYKEDFDKATHNRDLMNARHEISDIVKTSKKLMNRYYHDMINKPEIYTGVYVTDVIW